MRVIVAQLDISPETRATFVAYMTHYVEQTRTEQGNLGFDLTADLAQPGRFTMVEQWADDDAIRAHFAEPYVRDFLAWRTEIGLDVSGQAFLVADAGPVMDVLTSIVAPPPR